MGEVAKGLRGCGTMSCEGDARDRSVVPQGHFDAEADAARLDVCLTFSGVACG